jgi:putative membrane protein
MSILLNLLVTALALLVVDIIFPGVSLHSFAAALLAGAVIGVINGLVRPILTILSLPITLLTLGLFLFVVNGICFWLASVLVPGFAVHGFLTMILAPIVLALVSTALNQYFATKGIGLDFKLPQFNKTSLPEG